MLQATVGKESVYTFQVVDANDGDTVTVSIEGGTPAGAALSSDGSGAYTLRWTLASAADATPINIEAIDDKGAGDYAYKTYRMSV